MNETEYIKKFTDTYKKYDNKSLREIKCLEVMFDFIFQPIQEHDYFAGRLLYPPVGLAPEPLGGRGVCYNYDKNDFKRLEPEEKAFWENENTRRKIRQAFPEDIAKALPHDDVYYLEYGIAFPLYRVVGIFLDYDKLLTHGINGLKAITNNKYMLMALDLFKNICLKYAKQAKELQKHELSTALENISANKPKTFYEAIQLSFLYTLASGSYNYGRMDEYLGDFYANDTINEETALKYLLNLWELIAARKSVFHGRVIIGGMGRRNEENADKLALLCIEATRQYIEIEPQLTLRFYDKQNPALIKAAINCIKEGRTYPMLYNDDINIKAVMSAFEVEYEEAAQYLPFGCGEYVLNHKSFGSPNGIINMLKALEVTISGGVCLETGEKMGPGVGKLTDFNNFDDFYNAYKQQLTYYIKILARQQKIEYEIVAEQADFWLMSILYDDCIEQDKSIFNGGIKYLGGTLETYGNVNTANSLIAIKKYVFDEKSISPQELIDALKANFKGYEYIRNMLINAPKYGNDNDYADNISIDLHEFVCNTTKAQKDKAGLHSYLVVIINNEANTILGRFTGASADGRLAKSPMANANSPAGGTDINGITAMLNSLVKLKPNIHAGAVQNMKFSKKNKYMQTFLQTYFEKGGTQAMITVLDKNDLINAMQRPDEYKHLMVRVGGFSARFVSLSKDVQEEILSRTLYE